MEPLVIKNAVDTWTDQDTNEEKKQGVKLRARAGAGLQRRIWLFFNPAWPIGATCVSAKLRIWNGSNITTSTQLTVDRVTAKWGVNRIKFSNEPGVAGTPVTPAAKATAPPDTMWEFDVTPLVQVAMSGGAWFGFRITSNNTTGAWWYASEATPGRFRPQLVVEWAEIPEEPDQLSPSDNLAVSLQRPTLTYDFNDVFGETELVSQQIQFGTSQALLEAGTTTFDTGEYATSEPMYDTTKATPGGTWAGLSSGANVWWRVRAKDSEGLWSVYSDPVQFQRLSKGTLTITSPTGGAIWSGRIPVTWTFTGRTQRAYQVAIAPASNPSEWLWDSGKVTSTDLTHTIPFGVVKDTSITYVVIVRVWDTETRQATPGDPIYTEAMTSALTVSYDATVTGITALAAVSDPVLPIAHLTWTRAAGVPNFYQIQRSYDAGVTWEYIAEEEGADLNTSGTSYKYDDTTVPMYTETVWRVLVVLSANRQSTGSTASTEVKRIAPFLMERDGSNAVCFLNPERNREYTNLQEVHTTLSGENVLVTQNLGKRRGTVSGVLSGDAIPGVTSKQMKNRFERLRDKSGQPMVVAVADESILVAAFNFQYDIQVRSDTMLYPASFEWVEL